GPGRGPARARRSQSRAQRDRGPHGRCRAPVPTIRGGVPRPARATNRRAARARQPEVTDASVAAAVLAIKSRTSIAPDVAVILGTGLGALADDLDAEATLAYPDIPGFPTPTVETHAGRLLFGSFGKRRIAIMQGRFHKYEGYTLQQVAFPVRVLRALGAKTLIVSNVSGGMHPLWSTGDLVLISDHINLLGDNPLVGPNVDSEGPRFPDMSAAYDPELRKLARTVALEHKIVLREGVYVAVPGPNLETRAEYRMLRALGADLVGM